MSTVQDNVLYARDAEQAVVAALFAEAGIAQEVFDRLALELDAEDFYFSEHRVVFEAYMTLTARDVRPDRALLAGHIRALPSYTERLGTMLTEAIAAPFDIENISAYAEAIREKATARRLKLQLESLLGKVGTIGAGASSADILREVDAVSLGFEDTRVEQELLLPPADLLRTMVEQLEAIQGGGNPGKKFGIAELDEKTGGMQPGDLIIIAGRPAMGKTAASLETVIENGVRSPKADEVIAVFSLEMSKIKLAFRLVSNIGSIDHDRLRKAALTEEDWPKLSHAMGQYEGSNIHIDCDPTLSPAILRSKLRALQRSTKKKIGLVVIDYLQLMEVDGRTKHDNRNAEITYISRNLKKIGKEFSCPVVALAQLNRGVEQRANKRPMMSDLRDSGAIEQDADIIIGLYRDEYYNPESEHKGLVEWLALKSRDTELGTVMARFIGEYQQFRGLERGSYGYESKYGGAGDN